MLKKALVVIVGTGTRSDVDIVRPLVKTVRDSRPDYTLLVATEESGAHAERIPEELNGTESGSGISALLSPMSSNRSRLKSWLAPFA